MSRSQNNFDIIIPKVRIPKVAMPKLKEVADSLGGIRVIHVCGRTKEIIPDLLQTGFDAYSLEEDVSLIKEISSEMRLLGNVSSKKALVRGSIDEVKNEIDELTIHM